MSLPYGFERDKIPESYEKITWQERQERCPNDYGPPQVSTTPEDWAKIDESWLLDAIIF